MEVICNSIGSVPTHSNAIKTECSMCGAAQPHEDTNCLKEPCPWNKDAKCVPVKEALEPGKVYDFTFEQKCTICGGTFFGNTIVALCPTCYV